MRLSARQCEILSAFAEWQRVSVVSGHKVGKSTMYAVLALWFFCTMPESRVVITATTDNQVNGIIWREIRRLVKRAARAGIQIPGANNIHELARSGLVNPADLSEIKGYTAKQAEAIAGVSGPAILYLVDEASGVVDFIFQAIEGNRAGGNAWVFLASNPTRGDGEFYDSHHSKSHDVLGKHGYRAFHVDSRESPNVTGEWQTLEEWRESKPGGGDWAWRERTKMIPGMAQPGWVEEKIREWGEDSALFKIRVAGLFVAAEEGKVFPATLLAEAVARHGEAVADGRLYIGCDPAGDSEGGDASSFCARRGLRVLEFRGRSGMSVQAHLAEIDDIIATHKLDKGERTKPIVCIDAEGKVGWDVYVALREHGERSQGFEVCRVRSSEKARRQPLLFDRWRDELYANGRAFLRDGGSIPDHARLQKDLHAASWYQNDHGRQKATHKDDLRKLLGRSPNDGDSFLLAVWEPTAARQEDEETRPAQAAAARAKAITTATPVAPSMGVHEDDYELGGGINPYAGARQWGG